MDPSKESSGSSARWRKTISGIKKKSGYLAETLTQKDKLIAELQEQLAKSQDEVATKTEEVLQNLRLDKELRDKVESVERKNFNLTKVNIALEEENRKLMEENTSLKNLNSKEKGETEKWKARAIQIRREKEKAEEEMMEMEKSIGDLGHRLGVVEDVEDDHVDGTQVEGFRAVALEPERFADEEESNDSDDFDDGASTETETVMDINDLSKKRPGGGEDKCNMTLESSSSSNQVLPKQHRRDLSSDFNKCICGVSSSTQNGLNAHIGNANRQLLNKEMPEKTMNGLQPLVSSLGPRFKKVLASSEPRSSPRKRCRAIYNDDDSVE